MYLFISITIFVIGLYVCLENLPGDINVIPDGA